MPLRRALALPLAVLVLSLAAALTGCTDDSDESVEPPATATTTPTATAPPTVTAAATPTATATPTPTPSPTATPAPTPTATATPSPTATPTTTRAATATPTPEPTASPTPSPTTFPYTTYDTSGAVAEPGSYAFLADPTDTSSVVTTYEGLRDGTARALRIHETDADGVARAAFLDTVEAGDLFEWRQADDCFVRYTVTELLPEPSGPPRRLLGVEWMTYAFTGCSGPIAAEAAVTIDLGELPNLGGTSLPAPVMHGPYQLVPLAWEGEVKDWVALQLPARDEPLIVEGYNPSRETVLALPYWRDPDLPEGWYVYYISAGSVSDPSRGYTAEFRSPGGLALGLNGYYVPRMGYPLASSTEEVGGVIETRVIDGRLALVSYNTPKEGEEGYDPFYVPNLWIYDHATGTGYTLTGHGVRDINVLIEIARSLFEPPNPQ